MEENNPEEVTNIEPIEGEYIDEEGNEEKITIQPMNNYSLNIGKANYQLANELNKRNPYKNKKGLLRMDVGIRSQGFARIAILATIISISVIIILYLIFKF